MNVVGLEIGTRHQQSVEELLVDLEAARAVAPREFIAGLDQDRQRLKDWRCRVAIIGQVKAGKSTFLGSLIDKPGFLPSDVNPWTTVVTNLHMGHVDDPTEGGRFHFFDEDAWDRIANGNAETRKMAEEMLPGFESETLKQQVEEMRTKARERLGVHFPILLGSNHKYDFVSRDTLARYVCAGPENPTTKPSDTLGRYSDITERADIFLPPGPFAFPIVLSDTPGVNDPFLVRDELTCRSLTESDVFIVMMSAHQALTDVDLSLIRMLCINPSNKIIVFINRIDELTDLSADIEIILKDVRTRLDEFLGLKDGQQINVIAGSAHWAELSLAETQDDPELKHQAERADLKAYAKESGIQVQAPDKMLFALSGIRQVRDAIADAVENGIGRQLRNDVAQSVIKSLDTCKAVLKAKRRQVEAGFDETDGTAQTDAQLLKQTSSERENAEAVANELHDVMVRARLEAQDQANASYAAIRRDLEFTAADFISERLAELAEAVENQSNANHFDVSLLPLRHAIEDRLAKSYQSARKATDQHLQNILKEAAIAARPVLGDAVGMNAIKINDLPHDHITPAFPTPMRTLSLELTSNRGLAFWKSKQLSTQEAAEKLGQLIRIETTTSIEQLVESAQIALAKRSEFMISRIEQLTTAATESISEHLLALDSTQNQLNNSTASGEDSEKAVRALLQPMLEKLDADLAVVSEIEARIERHANSLDSDEAA